MGKGPKPPHPVLAHIPHAAAGPPLSPPRWPWSGTGCSSRGVRRSPRGWASGWTPGGGPQLTGSCPAPQVAPRPHSLANGYELFEVSEERDEEVAAFCHMLDV